MCRACAVNAVLQVGRSADFLACRNHVQHVEGLARAEPHADLSMADLLAGVGWFIAHVREKREHSLSPHERHVLSVWEDDVRRLAIDASV